MQSENPASIHPAAPQATTAGSNALRAQTTRHKVCEAVVTCLDEVGYSATSISRVQALAGVSRGALTHHFPSKEDLMVETLERLLDPVRGQSGGTLRRRWPESADAGDGLQRDLVRLWCKVVDTREGRALLEILVAARTDPVLQRKIGPSLKAYDREINRNLLGLYRAAKGPTSDDEVVVLWAICRAFLRGLHLQCRFDDDPQKTRAMIEYFGRIMAPHMDPRGVPGEA